MRIHYDAGETGLADVGYTIFSANGDVYSARTTNGVTEEPAGSGSYGVTVSDSTLMGRTVVWDHGVGTIGASETFMDIAAAVANIMGGTGELYIGSGLGDNQYIDWLTGISDEPIAKAIIRVFPYDQGVADFTDCKARVITEADGRFELWLEAGWYVMRVEKASTLIKTIVFEVEQTAVPFGVSVGDGIDVGAGF